MAIGTLFGSFIALILIGVPVGYCIGFATLVTLYFNPSIPMLLVTQNAVSGCDSFPLMAIPFFILAGNLMSSGGVAKRLVKFANQIFGVFAGGLGIVTTISCMFFAAISGSALATTSAIGAVMIPEMEEYGYDRAFSASLTASAGSIGVIIPPSIPLVIYGVVVSCSISELFIAGLVPGILMGLALMVVCYILSKKYGYVGTGKVASLQEIWTSFKDAFWALLTPIIILGGIYSGIFTPTEAAVIAVVYALFTSMFIYKELTLKELYKTLFESINVNGLTTFMVGLSTAFCAYLTIEKIPVKIATFLVGITTNKFLLLLLINLFLLGVGCLIDNVPATIILSPILLPVVTNVGMSPVTFGVMLTMNLAIGFATPPYGINLFVASAISGVSIGKMMRFMVWFIAALLIVLMITTFVPFVTEGIVTLMTPLMAR